MRTGNTVRTYNIRNSQERENTDQFRKELITCSLCNIKIQRGNMDSHMKFKHLNPNYSNQLSKLHEDVAEQEASSWMIWRKDYKCPRIGCPFVSKSKANSQLRYHFSRMNPRDILKSSYESIIQCPKCRLFIWEESSLQSHFQRKICG